MPAEGLQTRFFTSVAVALVLLAIFFFAPSVYGIVALAALVLAGAWEWAGFLPREGTAIRIAYTILVGLMLVAVWLLAQPWLTQVLWVALGWWTLAFIWVLRFPTPIPRWLVIAGGLFVLVPGWLGLALLHDGAGPYWLVFFLTVIAAADTGAYFTGRAFGRLRLAPSVSPGKTWEGALGGLAVVTLVALAGSFGFGRPVAFMVPLCIAVGLASIVGDLTISMFKRHAGLKDSGRLFPGHGGVLDRIDSIAAGAPLFMIGLGWFGYIT